MSHADRADVARSGPEQLALTGRVASPLKGSGDSLEGAYLN
jgi:hypothetical protein